MARTGQCICGAVRLEIATDLSETQACHCGMCRKFSGGVYLAVQVPPGEMTISGEENLKIYPSSDWAERAFCGVCGSSLFYRVTLPGPYQGTSHVALGCLDDTSGINLSGEIYIDRKPDAYAFAGDTQKMTEAQVIAMFAPPET